jgi:hypothetical protein
MEIILYGLFFITGILVHSAYTYVLGLGTLAVTTKQSVDDSLLIMGTTYEKIIGMNESLYKGMIDKGIDEKEIEIHRRMDKAELEALMNIVVINLKGVVPARLGGFANFHDWKTANKEITKIIKFRTGLDKQD